MENNTGKHHGWINRLLAALLLVYLMLGLLAGVQLVIGPRRTGNAPEATDCGVGLTLDPGATEARPPESEINAEQDVTIAGTGVMIVSAGRQEVPVDFYNPRENEGRYTLAFELRLPDESLRGYEVLYASGLVDPGQHIYEITLARALEKGVYDVVVHIQPYRMDQGNTRTNNADILTRLIVR